MFQDNARIFGTEEQRAARVGQTLRRLLRYFRPFWLSVALAMVFVIASVYTQVLVPDLIGQATDCYLVPFLAGEQMEALGQGGLPAEWDTSADNSPMRQGSADNCWYTSVDTTLPASTVLRQFGLLILLIVALYLGSAVFSGLTFFLMSWAGFHVLRDIQKGVFAHVQRLSMGYFGKHEAGDVMSRFTNDSDTLQQMIGFGLISVLQGALLIVWTIAVMLQKSWAFALISLVTLPFMFLATRWFSAQARKAFRRARKEIGSVNADLQESISSVREVQAFSREDENIEQFRTQNAANRDANIRAQAYTSALAPTLEAFSYVSLAVVAVVGGALLLNQGELFGTAISVGLIITFIGYTQQFNRPVQQISVLWTNLQSAIAGAERIFNLLDEPLDIVDRPNALTLPMVEGRVTFEGVWAEYNPEEPVLRGVTISAEPGQTIALVGPTGAGKTTIINLLPRFMDVSQGVVRIDGHDVREITGDSLRSQIGIVLQDTFLFSTTIMENIRYGRPAATDDEVIAAAQLARAHTFIEKLPDGYQTVLGERGGGLSQGQRQLLAIARVALMEPRILVLDEATSSVDTRTERQIQQALDTLLAGRTSFVVAHRLSTIRNADQVLYIEAGEIIERGTHDTLLAQGGAYHDLYMSQFRHREEAG
jgi:ATP-binding cassette subfamily B protein